MTPGSGNGSPSLSRCLERSERSGGDGDRSSGGTAKGERLEKAMAGVGVRVIYFTRSAEGEVVLLTLYAKSKTDNLTGRKLKEIRRALEE